MIFFSSDSDFGMEASEIRRLATGKKERKNAPVVLHPTKPTDRPTDGWSIQQRKRVECHFFPLVGGPSFRSLFASFTRMCVCASTAAHTWDCGHLQSCSCTMYTQ